MKKKKTPCNSIVKKWLEARGYHVAVVEQTIPKTFIKRDAWGWVDMIAVGDSDWPLFIQVTSRGHISDRTNKAKNQPAFKFCDNAASCYVAGVDKTEDGNRIKWMRINGPGEPYEEQPK